MPSSETVLEGALMLAKAALVLCDISVLHVLKPVAGIAVQICELAKTAKSNKDAVIYITEYSVEVTSTIVTHTKSAAVSVVSADIEHDASTLKQILEDIQQYVGKFQKKSTTLRFLLAPKDKDDVDQFKKRLQDSLDLFGVKQVIGIRVALSALTDSHNKIVAQNVQLQLAQDTVMNSPRYDLPLEIHPHYIDLEVDNSVIRLNPGRHGQTFAIRVEKVLYSPPNIPVLRKEYLNISCDVFEELHQEHNFKIRHGNIVQVFGQGIPGSEQVLYLRDPHDCVSLSKYLSSNISRGGSLIEEERWGHTILDIVEFFQTKKIYIHWHAMFLPQKDDKHFELDWFVVQKSQLVLLDWVSSDSNDQHGLRQTAAQVARGYMTLNDHGNWWCNITEPDRAHVVSGIVSALTLHM